MLLSIIATTESANWRVVESSSFTESVGYLWSMLNNKTVHLLFSKLDIVKNMDINSESFLVSSYSPQQKSSFMIESCKRREIHHKSQFLNETKYFTSLMIFKPLNLEIVWSLKFSGKMKSDEQQPWNSPCIILVHCYEFQHGFENRKFQKLQILNFPFTVGNDTFGGNGKRANVAPRGNFGGNRLRLVRPLCGVFVFYSLLFCCVFLHNNKLA